MLQLHRWDAHDHPHLGSREAGPVGNGALLWFHTEAFDHAVVRVKYMQADVLQGPMANPNAGHREIRLRDPDGYVVVVAGI